MKPPEGFVPLSAVGAVGFARPEADDDIRARLVRWGSLERSGAHDPGATRLEGRGTVHVVDAPDGGRWVIRRYRRGGWMAPLLGDRYLRRGTPRPLTEARASEAARERGIPTPRVVAGVAYPIGLVYRAELVSEFVPDTRDLGSLLFDSDDATSADPAVRMAWLEAAGRLTARLAEAGILHRDLNARNLLIEEPGGRAAVHVVDLDRAAVRPPGSLDVGGMGARLERSLRKLGRRSDRALGASEWRALARGLSGGSA